VEQGAVFGGYLLRRTHEDATGPVNRAGFDARGDQPHDLFLQLLPVTGVIFVPDHQVHHESFQAPVSMGLHKLAHEIDVGRSADLKQHDRQVAGDGVTPQARLATAVLDEQGRIGAQRGIGVDDATRQPRIQLRVGLCSVDLAQHDLAVGPSQVENAVREMAVVIFVDQAQGRVAGVGDARDNIDRGRLLRIQGQQIADGDNRIQHRAVAARQRRRIVHGQRGGGAAGAADEAQAVGLVGHCSDIDTVRDHQVEHPGSRLAQRTRSARAQDGTPLGQNLGLDKKVAEGRVQFVGGRRRDDDFGITRDIDLPALPRAIGDAHPAQLDVIFGRHDDLGMRLEIAVA
jgi:hypothetical protein